MALMRHMVSLIYLILAAAKFHQPTQRAGYVAFPFAPDQDPPPYL